MILNIKIQRCANQHQQEQQRGEVPKAPAAARQKHARVELQGGDRQGVESHHHRQGRRVHQISFANRLRMALLMSA